MVIEMSRLKALIAATFSFLFLISNSVIDLNYYYFLNLIPIYRVPTFGLPFYFHPFLGFVLPKNPLYLQWDIITLLSDMERFKYILIPLGLIFSILSLRSLLRRLPPKAREHIPKNNTIIVFLDDRK